MCISYCVYHNVMDRDTDRDEMPCQERTLDTSSLVHADKNRQAVNEWLH